MRPTLFDQFQLAANMVPGSRRLESKLNVVRYLVGAWFFGWTVMGAAQEGRTTLPAAEFLRLMPADFVRQFPQGTQARQVTDVKRVFDSKLSMLRDAYDQARARNPGIQGEVDLSVALVPSGRVAGAQVVRSSATMPSCKAWCWIRSGGSTLGRPAREAGITCCGIPWCFGRSRRPPARPERRHPKRRLRRWRNPPPPAYAAPPPARESMAPPWCRRPRLRHMPYRQRRGPPQLRGLAAAPSASGSRLPTEHAAQRHHWFGAPRTTLRCQRQSLELGGGHRRQRSEQLAATGIAMISSNT